MVTRVAKAVEFINDQVKVNEKITMDEVCLNMVHGGVAYNETDARDLYRYIIRAGKAKGEITLRPRGRKRKVEATEVKVAPVIETPVVETEVEITPVELTKEQKLAQKRARDAQRKREKRAAAKAAQAA